MRKNTLILAILILLCPLISASCAANERVVEVNSAVTELFVKRAEAFNSFDEDALLSTLDPDEATLASEETSLLRSAKATPGFHIDIDVLSAVQSTRGVWHATLIQTMTTEQGSAQCQYKARLRESDGIFYFSSYLSNIMSVAGISVEYTDGARKLAQGIISIEHSILEQFKQRLSYSMESEISIELYADKALFLQSVKADAPQWMSGWTERGQSIKSLVDSASAASAQERVLRHETAHCLMSELTRDNAAYWLQEGFASLCEAGIPTKLSASAYTDSPMPFSALQCANLEALGNAEAALYYDSAKAYAAMLVSSLSWDGFKDMLCVMRDYDSPDVTASEKLDVCNAITAEALQSAGFDVTQIEAAFAAWRG